MEKIIIYFCFVLIVNNKFSEVLSEEPVECIPAIEESQTLDLEPIIVVAEHLYSSVTNGRPYSKGPSVVGNLHLGGNVTTTSFSVSVSRSNVQKVTIAYNGTHVCSSAQLRLEKDTCWAGSSTGCNNMTNACDSVCFPSKSFYKKHTLRLFDSVTSSYSIGTWTMSDYLTLYSTPSKELTCFHRNDSYRRWTNFDKPPSYPGLDKIKCPVGQRCRVTTGKEMYSSPLEIFVGCERDSNQFDGCDESCSYHEKYKDDKWVLVCKHCCMEDLCNDPYKCKGSECDLSSKPIDQHSGAIIYKPNYATIGLTIVFIFRDVFICKDLFTYLS